MTTAPIGSREFAKRQLHGGLCSDDLLPPDSMLAGVSKKPGGGKFGGISRAGGTYDGDGCPGRLHQLSGLISESRPPTLSGSKQAELSGCTTDSARVRGSAPLSRCARTGAHIEFRNFRGRFD